MEIFRLFGSILVDSSEADKSIQKTGDNAKSLASKLGDGIKTAGKWAAGIASAAGAAASAAGAAAINVGKEYEVSLQKVSTIADPAIKSIGEISNAVLALSNKTGQSAAELNEAIYQAISGSVSTADAVDFVEQATKLAAGGFTDTSTAVDILTTAINAYGEQSGLTAESVSDMLLTTQNLGKTDVGQLAASMGKIIPTAASVGVQMDELSGMYAVVTANGIATAEATTYMNSMMNELAKNGGKAANNFADATKEITGTETSFRDFVKNGGSVTEALQIMTEYAEQAGVSLGDCFGSAEAGKAALVISANADKVNKAVSEMGNSAGATEKAYASMTNTLEHKTESIKNQLKNIGVEAYNSMAGPIADIADSAISIIKDNLPAAQDLLTRILKSLSNIVKSILPQALNIIQKLIAPAMKLADNIVNPLIEMIDEIFPPIMDFFESLIEPVSDLISSILPTIIEFFKKLVPIITDIIKELLPPLVDILNDLMPIIDILFELLEPILDVVKAIISPLGKILKAIEPIIEKMVVLIEKALQPFQEELKGASDDLNELLGPALDYIANMLEKTVLPMFSAVVSFFEGDWSKGVQNAGTAFVNAFQNAFELIDGLFGTNLAGWYSQVTEFFNGFGSYLYSMSHQGQIDENALHSKYSSTAQDVRLAANEYMRNGMSAEDALNKAKAKYLGSNTEALYYWDNYGNYDAAQAYANIQEAEANERARLDEIKKKGEEYRNHYMHLATGGLVYGDTLAVVGDNADAARNPEVVAPLSDLSAMIADALSAVLNKPSEQTIIVQLSDGTELTRALVNNINDLTRQDGRCVIRGV